MVSRIAGDAKDPRFESRFPNRFDRDSNIGPFASSANRLTITPPLTCEAMGKHGAVWCGSGKMK
ncbi:hypothetical protein OUZ56_022515 [Daphnia magna]|uniref:Uncharacterized protein n=1 Tax=Daphnia magna TaxID=35525 RepID=A0ABR0AWW9_9CRUS|nr:hypothetical protein OUZ56_022515 [Daphnia magna]